MKKQSCADRIRIALDRTGMTQTELSKKTGIPKSAISQYIKGSFEPKQDRIYIISKALHVSEAWLMGFDVPMNEPNAENKSNVTFNPVADDEIELLSVYRKLNESGKKKTLEYIHDLTDMPKYTDSIYKIAARNGKFEEKPLSDSEVEELLNYPDVDDL